MEFVPYQAAHLPGIVALCEAEGWPSIPSDLERAQRLLTNPGVHTYVAVESGQVLGFIYLLSDGEVQAYIATMAVAAGRRGEGIGRSLIGAAFAACGAERIDLLSAADGFYAQLRHQRVPGFRLYPPFEH